MRVANTIAGATMLGLDVEEWIADHLVDIVVPSTFFAQDTEEDMRLSGITSTTVGTRTIDLLHVAAALSQGVTGLVSFDHRQCAAARLAGLKVVDPVA